MLYLSTQNMTMKYKANKGITKGIKGAINNPGHDLAN